MSSKKDNKIFGKIVVHKNKKEVISYEMTSFQWRVAVIEIMAESPLFSTVFGFLTNLILHPNPQFSEKKVKIKYEQKR